MKPNNLHITDVKVFLLNNDNGNSKIKAFASIILNDAFRVTGMRIVEGAKGLFASFPRRKDTDGNFWDIAAPLNKELYQLIQDEVIHKYTVECATA
ncbi:MAG: SpoVG family protein [bacterium]